MSLKRRPSRAKSTWRGGRAYPMSADTPEQEWLEKVEAAGWRRSGSAIGRAKVKQFEGMTLEQAWRAGGGHAGPRRVEGMTTTSGRRDSDLPGRERQVWERGGCSRRRVRPRRADAVGSVDLDLKGHHELRAGWFLRVLRSNNQFAQ